MSFPEWDNSIDGDPYGVPTGYVPRRQQIAILGVVAGMKVFDPNPPSPTGTADPYGVPTGYVPRRRKHGDLVREGDEFNHDPMYYCAVCDRSHTCEAKGCDGLRRPLSALGPLTEATVTMEPADPTAGVFTPTTPTDSEILASVRAFVALHGKHGYVDVDTIRRLVHPAPAGSTC